MPQDVRNQALHHPVGLAHLTSFLQIVVETVIALILGILGATLNAPELKEITWRSEMAKRQVVFLCLVFNILIIASLLQKDRRYGLETGLRQLDQQGKSLIFSIVMTVELTT